MISFSPLAVLWTSLPGLLKAQRYVSRDRRKIPEFIAATPGWCRSQRMQIQAVRSGDKLILSSLWREAIKPYFLQACGLLRGVTMLFSDPATRLRLDLIRLAGEADANTIMSNLAGSAADLESLGPLVGLAQVARGDMSRDAYEVTRLTRLIRQFALRAGGLAGLGDDIFSNHH